jgi:limonene 1,2-monooxygenase
MRPERMTFGIFMAPFHRVGENPTLAMRRDMELIQWMDELGYDEAWIGEHHSAGWEIIADPAVFIAAVAERTKQIKLGSGVVSLPYHHPLMVANRFVQLDHMTRGRVMLGVGPGALVSDAYMMGIDAVTQRPRMDEALGVIIRLLNGELVDHKSDWFELRQARLQLLPYTRPCFPIAVASQVSPAGMVTAGRYGAGVLSLGAGLPGGRDALAPHWAIAEEEAAKHGQTMRREEWKLVIPIHIAETREEAFNDVRQYQYAWSKEYFEGTLGRPHVDIPLEKVVEAGGMIIGTPEDAIESIEGLLEKSGGFGGVLGIAHEWANREKTLKSYELFARYVMPRFQGSVNPIAQSQQFVAENRAAIFSPSLAAIANAFKDAGREMPPELVARGGVRTQ